MKILIENVGRMKKSDSIDVPDDLCADDIADAIYVKVRKMGALMSRDVTTTWDEAERKGGIYAGGRLVGTSHADVSEVDP